MAGNAGWWALIFDKGSERSGVEMDGSHASLCVEVYSLTRG
jgi:hypothetical protein